MREYFREYKFLTKAGLLRAGHQTIIITILFMLLVGRYLGITLEIFIFILTPIGYMLDFDTNKYVMSYSLPISIKGRIRMLYHMMIVGAFLSVTMVHLSYYIYGHSRSIVLTLMMFMVDIIGGSLYYYLFCSPEFRKDILDQNKKQLIYQCAIGVAIGMGIAVRLKSGVNYWINEWISSLKYSQSIILLSSMLIITLWWTRHSMRKVEEIVRIKNSKV